MKSSLRAQYKNLRKNFVQEHSAHDFAKDLLRTFQQYVLPSLAKENIIALYSSMGEEANPQAIFKWLLAEGGSLAFPKMVEDTIVFVGVNKNTVFARSDYQFQEPQSGEEVLPDIVILPLLAFDDNGHRLGYGKGHYDRAITSLKLRKNPMLIGMAYPSQHSHSPLPHEEHDQKLDAVLLPDAYISFR